MILRIEDTDRERSTREFEAAQLRDLEWLGLGFDEGPYRQSERGDVYEASVARLMDAGLAYQAEDEAGRRALYFRPREREGVFRDGLRGEVGFSKVDDFVLIKSDGTPAYNFAAVVDDAAMRITHVLRGEEHLSNTARQALLYRALGEREPQFLHLGLILAPDGTKLSKRHGARSIAEHRREGYLPEAILSYLALLGWSHPAGKEEFAGLDDLAREWDPARLGASPAILDPERLLGLNARRVRSLSPTELLQLLPSFLEEPLPQGRELIAVEAIQEEMRVLSDAPRLVREMIALVDPGTFVADLPESSSRVYAHAEEILAGRRIEGLQDGREIVGQLRAWAKEEGIKTRDLLHPLRLALTGRHKGPQMPYLFAVLGALEARERIKKAREAIL